MRYQSQLHTVGIAIGVASALGALIGCGSSEPSASTPAKQPSQTTCAEFMQLSESDQFDMVERAAKGKPGWEIEPANGDEPSVELRTATSIVKDNCGRPDAADKTVADSVYVQLTTTVPTP